MKLIFSILTLLFVVTAAMAQPPVARWTLLPDSMYRYMTDIAATDDGGFIATGLATVLNPWSPYDFIAKVDGEGQVEWCSRYSNPAGFGASGVCATVDGGYVTVGRTASAGRVIWWTPNGQVRLPQSVGNDQTILNTCVGSPDGGIVVGGYQGGMFLVQKVDSTGALGWNWSGIGGWPHAIIRCNDGGYLAGGVGPNYVSALVKFDSTGTHLWTQFYGTTPYNTCITGITRDRSNGYYIACGSHVLHVDSTGLVIWQSEEIVFSPLTTNYMTDIALSNDGSPIVTFQAAHPAPWGGESVIANLDTEGQVLWFDTSRCFEAGNPRVTPATGNNTFWFVGSGSGWPKSSLAIWLSKYCPTGSDAGHPVLLFTRSDTAAFRLVHEEGQLTQVTFTGFAGNVAAWVTGDAASSWSSLPNGDGNDGDSIIFESIIPLFSGSIDSFLLAGLSGDCMLNWSAGCRRDTASVPHASMQFVSMEATLVDPSYGVASIDLHTSNESGIVRYELWKYGDRYPSATLVDSFSAEDGPGVHNYVIPDTIDPFWHQTVFYVLELIDSAECVHTYLDHIAPMYVAGAADELPAVPQSYSISAYPNPFNPSTHIVLQASRVGRTALTVFDLLGRHVATLYNGMLAPGEHKFTFDGSNLPSGIYFARVQAGEFVKTQKLLLLK